jgi:ABC-type sugar transport system ATPase subunit
VSKTYDTIPILEQIDLEIQDAEFVSLLGPSGSGKTTLLRVIAGLIDPDGGEVVFDDKPVTRLPPNRRNIAMVFQDYALYPNMRVRHNLEFCLRLRGLARSDVEKRVESVARTLDIEALLDRWPQQLSGGQKQRVALGRAMVRQPDVFLLDEPLSNLDAQLRVSMRAELQRIHRQLQVTMVHVTHDQEEAMSVSQRIALLNRGRVEQFDTPRALYRRPANVFVARFVGTPSINLLPCEVMQDANGWLVAGQSFAMRLSGEASAPVARDLRKLLAGMRPEDLTLMPTVENACLGGEITIIEELGKDAVIHLKTGEGTEIVVRTVISFPIEIGQVVGVNVNESDLYLFEQPNGRAVRCKSGN